MRKAFNFYRSYWDVANELNDKERLEFYDALLKREFTGEESELSGMVKFAYLSQKHSIDNQVEGYLNKTNKLHPNLDPWQGGIKGGKVTPTVQEEEEGEEKEEGKEEEEEEGKRILKQPLRQPKIDINGFVIID
jgi:hypothetical protein